MHRVKLHRASCTSLLCRSCRCKRASPRLEKHMMGSAWGKCFRANRPLDFFTIFQVCVKAGALERVFLPFGSHVCSAERVRSCGSSYHLAGRCAGLRRRTDVLTTWQAYAQRVRSSGCSTYLFPGVPAALSECVGACVVIIDILQECAQSRARAEHARSNACSHHMWAVLSGRVFLPF